VVPLLFAYQMILLDWVYWPAVYTKVLTDSSSGGFALVKALTRA
jgi:hypothetical protein